MKALVLQLHLVQAYDWVDWGFLRLILLQIGLSLEATGWVMACVVSANYVVLINGAPIKISRGLEVFIWGVLFHLYCFF